MNFDPLKNVQKFYFFILCLNIIIKGYKSHSPEKFTKIYPLWQMAPSGPTSQKQGKIFDFWRFWQKSRLSVVRFPSRVAENHWRMSFGMFIVGTLVIKNPGNIRTKFRGSKSLQILVKIEFSTKSAQSEASLTKEIQWRQIENFKIVNFESHDWFFLPKWLLMI